MPLSQVFSQLLNTFLALGTLCLKYILALDKRQMFTEASLFINQLANEACLQSKQAAN